MRPISRTARGAATAAGRFLVTRDAGEEAPLPKRLESGKEIGQTGVPFGVFEVPADEAACELVLEQRKTGSPAAVRKRSTELRTTWKFRPRLDESASSQGIPCCCRVTVFRRTVSGPSRRETAGGSRRASWVTRATAPGP